MVKANVERGSGFRGVLNYGFGDGKGAEIVGGNMVGADPHSLAQEFALSREARSEVQRPVWHCSLSCPPGETLSAEQWDALTNDFMRMMDLDAHQFVAIRHTDTELDHTHIIASRISLDGELWHGQWEARRAINATQRLEREHGLTLTPGLDDIDVIDNKRTPKKAEIEQTDRTGEAPARQKLQEIVDAALEDPGTVFAFMDRLEAAGVSVRPNVASTGRLNGFSFEIDGIPFKGSQLGKAYSWKQLQARGIDYEQDRDGEALRARADATREAAAPERSGEPAPALGDAGAAGQRSGVAQRGEPERDAADTGGLREVRQAEPRRDPEGGEGGRNSLGVSSSGGGVDPNPAVDGDGRDVAGGRADWLRVADHVSDLAAPAHRGPVADQPGVSRAVVAKQRAWDEQHGALQSPAYRLTLKGRRDDLPSFNLGKGKGEDGGERVYDAAAVRNLIPYLSRQNVLGRDVYVTPLDAAHHYLVVDDMTPQTEAGLIDAGYRPALVQESSAGNRQAVLKVPKERGRDEQRAANQVVEHLNQRFGDPAFSGVVHPFRMAGFSNKKPRRGNAFTRVVEATGEICRRATKQLEGLRVRWREAHELKKQERAVKRAERGQERAKGLASPEPARAPPVASEGIASAWDHVLKQQEGLAVARGWELDPSRLDFRATVELLDAGWDEIEVATVIRDRSPGLYERHKNVHDYVDRTLDAAQRRIEERQAKRSRDRDDEPERGPGPG
jgi:hypothetical protein